MSVLVYFRATFSGPLFESKMWVELPLSGVYSEVYLRFTFSADYIKCVRIEHHRFFQPQMFNPCRCKENNVLERRYGLGRCEKVYRTVSRRKNTPRVTLHLQVMLKLEIIKTVYWIKTIFFRDSLLFYTLDTDNTHMYMSELWCSIALCKRLKHVWF
jgi:hypothetical protein